MPTLDPTAERVRTTNRILTALLILLALAAGWSCASNSVLGWYLDRNWSHGFLIVPMAGYLIWIRREELKRIPARPSWWGAIIAVLFLALYFHFFWIRGHRSGRTAAWPLVFVVPLAIWGVHCVRVIWPALLFTGLAVSQSPIFDIKVGTPLRKLSTSISGLIFSLIPGMGLEVQGVSLQIRIGNSSASLGVEDACSGFTYLMAVLALGMFMAFSSRRPLWQQVLISGSALPIALLTNAVRIVLMGLACLLFGTEAIGPDYHEWWGLAILPMALGLLVLEGRLLEKYFGGTEEQRTEDRGQSSRATEPQRDSLSAVAAVSRRREGQSGGAGEPTNQPTTEPPNQPTNEPTNQLTTEPTNQLTTKPTNQLTSQPANLLHSPVFWTAAVVLLLGAVGDWHFRGKRRAAEEALCIVPARTEPLRKPLAELKSATLQPLLLVGTQPLSDGSVRALGCTDSVQLTVSDNTLVDLGALTVNVIYYTGVQYIVGHSPATCMSSLGYEVSTRDELEWLPLDLNGVDSRGVPGRFTVLGQDLVRSDQRAYTLLLNRQNGWFVANQQEANERLLKEGYLGNYLQIVIYAPGPDGHREAFLRSAQRLLHVLLPVLEREYLPIGD